MHRFFYLILLIPSLTWAQGKIALVKLIRGEVVAMANGKSVVLKVDDWVSRGQVIKTAEKSFVKLIFIDKSHMNLGPNSEMKIEDYNGKKTGILDLVKGKIRSQVTKDYLQIQDKERSKLFIKTNNAVMGVRGTDFLISTNGVNTTTILFEGEVLLNKLDIKGVSDPDRLEEIVDRGVRIMPGEFSVVELERSVPTVPALLNIQQRELLERNVDMETEREPSNTEEVSVKSVVPKGLNGETVSNSTEILKKEVYEFTDKNLPNNQSSVSAEGYVDGDKIKPANGSIVHIDSGVIIPPDKGAVLDLNTNTFIPGKDIGKISASGNYVPPKNVEITPEGKILVAIKNDKGETIVNTFEPILSGTSNPISEPPKQSPPNATNSVNQPDVIIINYNSHHHGGVQGNTPEANAAQGIKPTTIIINEK